MYKFELMVLIVLTDLKVVLEVILIMWSNISKTKGQNNTEHKDFIYLCTYFVFIMENLSFCLFEMVFLFW